MVFTSIFKSQKGVVHVLPLLLILAAIGIISFLLISSTSPLGGLFGILNPKPASHAATNAPVIDMAYPCGFTNPAFCDNFSEGPAPVKGRGGDLDFNKWSFNRISTIDQAPNILEAWGVIPHVQHCKTDVTNIYAINDSFLCGIEVPEPEHWMEALDDHGGYIENSARIRQPFDFTTTAQRPYGTIQYGVDAKNSGPHGWWLETWITDQPIGVPFSQDAGNDGNSRPSKNGIGVLFTQNCQQPAPADMTLNGNTLTGVGVFQIIRDYVFTEQFNPLGSVCVSAETDVANMFQIRLSPSHMEVWASDAGSNVLKQIFATDINPPLPFSVGYVHFNHGSYNATKCVDENTGPWCNHYVTYHWHDMGFDGPVHPTPRVYEIPDSLTPSHMPGGATDGHDEAVNTGYYVGTDGTMTDGAKNISGLIFHNVNTTGAANANLILNASEFHPGSHIFYQWNNSGAWTPFDYPSAINHGTNDPPFNLGLVIPIPISALRNGVDNTLQLKTDSTWPGRFPSGIVVNNIDLEVNLPDSATPAPAAPMISCDLMGLMMVAMPNMSMPTDPCMGMPMPMPTPAMTATPILVAPLKIISPVLNQTVDAGAQSVNVTYTPNKNAPVAGIVKAAWQFDGGPAQVDNNFTGTFNVCGIQPGVHSISGFLLDASNNVIQGSDTMVTFNIPSGTSTDPCSQPSSTPLPVPTPGVLPTPGPTTMPSPSASSSPSTCTKAMQGDLDCNGMIDIFDYNSLVGNFGKTGTGILGDIDGNNKVDIFDYNILVGNFGK